MTDSMTNPQPYCEMPSACYGLPPSLCGLVVAICAQSIVESAAGTLDFDHLTSGGQSMIIFVAREDRPHEIVTVPLTT
ncbi:hypothetical protein [Nocardia aurantiaca]|uniref:Uncharacterized protein n=1 Tax=Nocardia aurantiaca TaxID=2675850 RepID=A0A6I3L4G2_9NOCA|nr:hypothetical protein [Nocardia aurantiaca]MTE15830.1 hypothetical protein [Nocardia aurantiaca]